MSERFPGGIISKTAPVPTGPYENGTAPGIWTLEQQAEFVRQGIWPIAGNVPNYIEDVFQTWLYTGNGSTQTINNGIDLAGKGGLVWTKSRSGAFSHGLTDTVRGAGNGLYSNTTQAQGTSDVSSFTSTGFGLTFVDNTGNRNGQNYVSWTFREQPKFFDVVTWSGDGNASRVVSHALTSQPGFIVIKRTSGTQNWIVAASDGAGNYRFLQLNTTDAALSTDTQSLVASSTGINVGWISSNWANVNASGQTFVAYLWASNAGGFGLTGTDNVISCGSFTTNGSGAATVNLGYEPQFVMFKRTDGVGDWFLVDVMRGFTSDPASGQIAFLYPNTSAAEAVASGIGVTSTGFVLGSWFASQSYIYIAIRRGPMRTPTTGTSVFAPVARAGTGSATTQSTGLNGVDLAFTIPTNAAGNNWSWVDRLRGGVAGSAARIQSNTTTQEFTDGPMSVMANIQDQLTYNGNGYNQSGTNYIVECFRRAPGFFDVACWTGTGAAFNNIPHNLNVVPELIITKNRSAGGNWNVYSVTVGNTQTLYLNQDFSPTTGVGFWNNTSPTSSVFTVGTAANTGTFNYVAYLFASCPGVSKVGSYTGTGATQVINCGFTGGARFVLIKATSTTGDWYVWDSARGIVAGNDPYLALNSTAAEVTNTDWVDTAASGFELSNAGGNLANSNGVSYIFLAVS